MQTKILNEPHEVSRVEHKQDRPKDRTLGTPTVLVYVRRWAKLLSLLDTVCLQMIDYC